MIFYFDEDGEPSSRTVPSLGEDIVHLWSTTSLQAPSRLARFRKSNIIGYHCRLIPAEVWSQILSYVNEKDLKSIVVANFPHASQGPRLLSHVRERQCPFTTNHQLSSANMDSTSYPEPANNGHYYYYPVYEGSAISHGGSYD
ncbi:hypothetical protein KCU73_g5065, partial [Aureobasidium melanogenum]